jgi:hypothetical protein
MGATFGSTTTNVTRSAGPLPRLCANELRQLGRGPASSRVPVAGDREAVQFRGQSHVKLLAAHHPEISVRATGH